MFEGSPHHQEMERSLWNYFSKLHSRGPSPPVQCQSAEFTASLCHHLILWLVPYPCTQSPGDNGRPSGHRIMVRNTRAAMWYREPRPAHVKACAVPGLLSQPHLLVHGAKGGRVLHTLPTASSRLLLPQEQSQPLLRPGHGRGHGRKARPPWCCPGTAATPKLQGKAPRAGGGAERIPSLGIFP